MARRDPVRPRTCQAVSGLGPMTKGWPHTAQSTAPRLAVLGMIAILRGGVHEYQADDSVRDDFRAGASGVGVCCLDQVPRRPPVAGLGSGT